MSEHGGLTVRHFERESIELPVDFVICDEHRSQVRFSTSSSAADQHTIHGWSTDVSPGGMGLRVEQFIPRMCEGVLRVFGPNHRNATESAGSGEAAASGSNDAGGRQPGAIFEHRAKVRRVRMRGETTSYDVGLEFMTAPGEQAQHVGDSARAALRLAARGMSNAHRSDRRGGAGHA